MNKMKFKDYIQENVIIPNKISIKTNDIDKLNNQFEETIVIFMDYVDTDDEMRAAYIPETEEIEVYISKNANFNTIEALVQHEIIHSIQDDKSGMRMINNIQKERDVILSLTNQIKKLNPEKDLNKIMKLAQKLSETENIRAFLNNEEYMSYAYMAVKMRNSDKIKEVLKDFNKWWKKMTGQKMNNKMLKYFYSYWLVKNEL